jgi:predicted molibdopterin-dependent oxidoreductase YjgC
VLLVSRERRSAHASWEEVSQAVAQPVQQLQEQLPCEGFSRSRNNHHTNQEQVLLRLLAKNLLMPTELHLAV